VPGTLSPNAAVAATAANWLGSAELVSTDQSQAVAATSSSSTSDDDDVDDGDKDPTALSPSTPPKPSKASTAAARYVSRMHGSVRSSDETTIFHAAAAAAASDWTVGSRSNSDWPADSISAVPSQLSAAVAAAAARSPPRGGGVHTVSHACGSLPPTTNDPGGCSTADAPRGPGSGFRVWDLGFRVQGLGFRV